MSNSVENIERAIEQAKKNIATFEEAIEKEREVIKHFHWIEEQANRKADEKAKAEEIGKHIKAMVEEDGSRDSSS